MSTDDTTARLRAAGWTIDPGGYWHSPTRRCLLPPLVAVGVLDEIAAARIEEREWCAAVVETSTNHAGDLPARIAAAIRAGREDDDA